MRMPQPASKRNERLEAIVHIIESGQIESQETLVDRLANLGYVVTQSSISRDLRDLQVGKVRGRYVVTRFSQPPVAGIISASTAGPNLIVLKTGVGAANLVALHIDQAEISEILGTIAGDDTIFLATESEADQGAALRKLGVRDHV